jgi:hypothetical protein
MQWIRSHSSFANAISLIALFVALGGTSLAAVSLTKNSVGAKQIKKDAVRASEIKSRAVGTSEVRNASLLAEDFRAGQLPAGAKGDKGDKGDPGDKGTFGSINVQFQQHPADLANGAETSVDVHCPAGQTAIGGGTRGDLTNSELTKVTASRPIISTGNSGAPADDGTFTGWRGTFVNENNGAGIRPEVWVICATP